MSQLRSARTAQLRAAFLQTHRGPSFNILLATTGLGVGRGLAPHRREPSLLKATV